MAPAPILSFRSDVSLVETPESGRSAGLTINWRRGSVTFKELWPGVRAALRTLLSGGGTEDDLGTLAVATDGVIAHALLHHYLQWCDELGLLCYTVASNSCPLATVVPMASGFLFSASTFGTGARFQLSRFAYCRRDGESLVLESPLSLARTVLRGPTGAGFVAQLVQPRSPRELSATVGDVSDDTAEAFVTLLANAGVVAEVDADGALGEEADSALTPWEFHDLLFHSRSRMGRHDNPSGATFPFLDHMPPLPALKPAMSGNVIPLYRPDISDLEHHDLPLTSVLEHRTSIREYGNTPISARQLGEFLYRVARIRSISEPDPARSRPYQTTSRPYPSGGATYDLELYVTVETCDGLPSGLYHYNPLDHQLHGVAARDAHIEQLLRDAQAAAALSSVPQVLITLTSRFQRLSWKYRSIAYATTLKNVGVLYQTMYLVATAMGLAPCALGGGNAALFAEAIGTDYCAESSVGEFALGSARGRPSMR
jgi:oxazoline/thiazoline dehydrogenase